MVLEANGDARSALVEHRAKVYHWWCESNSIDCEHSEQTESDWQDLVSSSDLDWNSHCEFLVFIFRWRLIVLLDKEASACLQNATVWLQLRPDLKRTIALNKSKSGIEVKVWFEIPWVNQLDLHGILSSIMQNDLLSVQLLVNQNLQIILFLVHINGHINTVTFNFNRDRFGVVLVLQKQSELLVNVAKFERDERELDFG